MVNPTHPEPSPILFYFIYLYIYLYHIFINLYHFFPSSLCPPQWQRKQDPSEIRSSFKDWWEKTGSAFVAHVPREDLEAGAGQDPPHDVEDLEFEDLENIDAEDLEEIDVEVVADDQSEPTRTAEEKISLLEDRSRVVQELKDMQDAISAAPMEDVLEDAIDQHPESDIAVTFETVHSELSKLAPFQWSNPASRGVLACLHRAEEMRKLVDRFIAETVIAQGLLSKAMVHNAHRAGENEWNIMVRELRLARQYNRYRGARNSRFASWMSAQESFAQQVAGHGPGADGADDAVAVRAVETCRPISSKTCQFVIFKHTVDGVVLYHVGLILSIYRGSISRSMSASRRITMAKPLSLPAPGNVVSRLRLLILEPVKGEKRAMVANPLSPHVTVEFSDICGEIVPDSEGRKGEMIYVSFPEASITAFESLRDGVVLFGKEASKPGKSKAGTGTADDQEKEVASFNIKSFSKNAAGEQNIQFLVFICCNICFFDMIMI